MEKGRIGFVQIQSKVGGECRLCNPWPEKTLTLYRNGKKTKDLSGSLLTFPTARGETITVVPKGSIPCPKKHLVNTPSRNEREAGIRQRESL